MKNKVRASTKLISKQIIKLGFLKYLRSRKTNTREKNTTGQEIVAILSSGYPKEMIDRSAKK